MTDESKHIDYLIARYLSGEATTEERTVVEEWRSLSVENSRYFDRLLQIFERAEQLAPDPQFDVDAAWKKVAPKIHHTKRISMWHRQRQVWYSAAASIAIIVAVWAGLHYNTTIKQQNLPIVATATTTSEHILLPDSSKAEVEPHSKIEYAKNFGKTNRDVSLYGNASFEVKHQPGPAFTVKVSGTLIRDIGTAFRVETKRDTSIVEVFVKSGSVVFFTNENKGIILKQGETGIYNKATRVFIKRSNATDEAKPTAIRAFNFQNTTLSEVISQLNSAYDVSIELGNPKLADCTITVRFENEDINTILSIVATTLNLKVEKRTNGYLLTGEECIK